MSETPVPSPVVPPQRVTVTDIDMPFWSMVVFMLKWALAAIPAGIVLVVVIGIGSVLVGGFAQGLAIASRPAESSSSSSYGSSARPPSDTREEYARALQAFRAECGTSTSPDCTTRRYVLDLRDKALRRDE